VVLAQIVEWGILLMNQIAALFASLPHAQLEVAKPGLVLTFLLQAAIIGFTLLLHKRGSAPKEPDLILT
jgi:hypothetical protein